MIKYMMKYLLILLLPMVVVSGCVDQSPVNYAVSSSLQANKITLTLDRLSAEIPNSLVVQFFHRNELTISKNGVSLERLGNGDIITSKAVLGTDQKSATYEFLVSGGKEGVSGYIVNVNVTSSYNGKEKIHYETALNNVIAGK